MDLIKTADGLDTIYSAKYNEMYHSKHGVLQEAQHVFLEGCSVSEKMEQQKQLSVLEIGFGTGFNFFLTAGLILNKGATMHYYAIENDLLNYDDFRSLNHNILFSENRAWINFLKWRKCNSNLKQDIHKITVDNIELFLITMDALQALLPENYFDAVYHDAFSPDVNQELWTASFFKRIKSTMKEGAQLATYSAKGSVKRSLIEAGFVVKKRPGSKGKREMLVATNQ